MTREPRDGREGERWRDQKQDVASRSGRLTSTIVVLVFFLAATCEGAVVPALSEPKLLLPMVSESSPPTSHVLTAEGGCFDWSIRRVDVASIKPLYHGQRDDWY